MSHVSKWDRKSMKIIDNSLANVFEQTKEAERNKDRLTKTDSIYKEMVKEALSKTPPHQREQIGNQLQEEFSSKFSSSSSPMVGKTQYVKKFANKILDGPDVLPSLKGKCQAPMEIISDNYASRKVK